MTVIGADRPGRGRPDPEARRRERPDRLRQRQPRRDGRRPQVGRGRPGRLREPEAPPQREHDAALEVVHGPAARATARSTTRVTRMGRVRPRRRGQGLPDRDHAELRDLPVADGLPEQARVGVVARRTRRVMMAAKKADGMAPPRVRREFFRRIEAPYKVTGINAGEVEAVHERTLENLHRQQLVEVQGQSDIVVFGMPYLGPYNVNSILNPILVHCLGLGYLFNMYRNQPLVREGGVAILYHPVPWEFHTIHHPELHRLLRGGPGRHDRPEGDRGALRGALRDRPLVHAPVPDVARVPRRAPVLHVVLGRARARPLRRRDLRRRRAEVASRASGYRRADSLRDALEMAKDTVGSSPDDHVLPRPADHDRGRALMGLRDRAEGRWPAGFRWGRRPLVPRERRAVRRGALRRGVPHRLGAERAGSRCAAGHPERSG